MGALLWDSFLESMDYQLDGECYTTNEGLAQNITFSYLDMTSVTETLRARSQAMLDSMAIGGSIGIAVGRLACLFNIADRGMILPDSIGFPFSYPLINAVSGAVENRVATFMIQSVLAGVIGLALLAYLLLSILRKKKIPDGDIFLIFLLAYGACQAICDSTRSDSLFLRSNGFVSIVQILGLGALLIPVILFSVRMVQRRKFNLWQIPLWVSIAGLLGLAGYMEYYVQRHGNEAVLAYSVMGTSLLAVVILGLLVRRLGRPANKQ